MKWQRWKKSCVFNERAKVFFLVKQQVQQTYQINSNLLSVVEYLIACFVVFSSSFSMRFLCLLSSSFQLVLCMNTSLQRERQQMIATNGSHSQSFAARRRKTPRVCLNKKLSLLCATTRKHRIVDWFMCECDETNHIGTTTIYCTKTVGWERASEAKLTTSNTLSIVVHRNKLVGGCSL